MSDINKIQYVNTETWELLTVKQLQDYYCNVVVKEQENYYETFNYWLDCCMTRNNGTLEEVTQITDTFYRAKDGRCFSTNEQMISDDVNTELSDLYYDCSDSLDSLALSLDTHTFEELINNYYMRLDDYNKDEIQKQLCLVAESNRSEKELEKLVRLMIDSTFFE